MAGLTLLMLMKTFRPLKSSFSIAQMIRLSTVATPFTLGVITISLSDLSVRYYQLRCGVAKEVSAEGLLLPMNRQFVH